MVARSRKKGPLADRLTGPVLRIRQPATSRPALNELEMDARLRCRFTLPGSDVMRSKVRSKSRNAAA
jgi:hypothetical protein